MLTPSVRLVNSSALFTVLITLCFGSREHECSRFSSDFFLYLLRHFRLCNIKCPYHGPRYISFYDIRL